MALSTPRQSVHDEARGLSAMAPALRHRNAGRCLASCLVAPKVTLVSAMCIVLAAAPYLWGGEAQNQKARGNASAFLVIGPQTRDRMQPGMLARAHALRTEWKQKELAAKKIADGPCMCGAPSHNDCKT